MKNRSRIIHACTCKDPHVLHFLKISALSRVFPQEMDIKITACSRVWGRIMHVALLDFHACIRKYSSLCDACTRMSVCGNTCVYTHSISRIYMRFYEDHVWLGCCKETDTSDEERKRDHVFTFVIREFPPFQSKLNFCNLMGRERKSNFHHVISTFE